MDITTLNILLAPKYHIVSKWQFGAILDFLASAGKICGFEENVSFRTEIVIQEKSCEALDIANVKM